MIVRPEDYTRLYTVKISVVDLNNNPIKKVKVSLTPREVKAITDSKGYATFSNIYGDNYTLSLEYNGKSYEEPIVVGGNNTVIEVRVILEETITTNYYLNILLLSLLILIIFVLLLIIFLSKKRRKKDTNSTPTYLNTGKPSNTKASS